jgi:RNA polymerase sigma factor (TIGR02999 family)
MTPTELLREWRGVGSREAFDQLTSLLYEELRRLARGAMRGERAGHTLQTHALLHEAYVRLADADIEWQDRAHFLAAAARTMRRVLVDHAKARVRSKRGGGDALFVTLTGSLTVAAASPAPMDVLVVNQALERLAAQDERLARIVELHFFGGLTHEEAGEALGISPSTVVRDLRLARAWLRRYIEGAGA